jgi:uncharacterized protein (DUF302 family)
MERQGVMGYAMATSVDRPFDEVVTEVREALAAQGFGVLTEIDIKTTLKKKIDADVAEQVILGACSPSHAHRALQADPSIGLLLPCNVVVRRDGDTTRVEAINPQMMVELSDAGDMKAVADEVSAKLQAALDSLK